MQRFSAPLRAVAFALTLLLLLTAAPELALAGPGAPVLELGNGFITLTVNTANGRFGLQSSSGPPLTFQPDQPETSFTTFRIDGEDYIYGNDYGFLGSEGQFVAAPANQGTVNQSTWRIQDLEITQELELVASADSPNVGNLRIRYRVRNTGDAAVQVGSRILLDTALGPEDGAPIAVPETGQFYTTETVLEDVPGYWQLVDHPISPAVMNYGFLSGWGNTPPDRMVLAHWSGLSAGKWDYTVDPNVNFTDAKNRYGTADSAVALYWEPADLGPGEERTFETYYGLGDFRSVNRVDDWALRVVAPEKLNPNATADGYVQDPFAITVAVDNTLGSGRVLPDVRVTLDLGPARGVLRLAAGESATKTISPAVLLNQVRTLSWRVEPMAQYVYYPARYLVRVSVAGEEEVVRSGLVVLPPVSGTPPELQVLSLLPATMHTDDANQTITLRGGGFGLLLAPDTQWHLRLMRKADSSDVIEIPTAYEDGYVDIRSDGIAIRLKEDLWGEAGGPRAETYILELDAGEDGVFRKELTFTQDERYRSRSYELLAVVGDANKQYRLETPANEAALAALAQSGNLLLTVRGKIVRKYGSTGPYYEVSPGAVINGMVQYTADEEVALIYGPDYQTLTFAEAGGTVGMTGVGVLSIPNFIFVNGPFAMTLAAGSSYSLSGPVKQQPQITWDPGENAAIIPWVHNFPLGVEGVTLAADGVSFQGSLILIMDLLNLSEVGVEVEGGILPLARSQVELKEARYVRGENGLEFDGLVAEGWASMGEDLIPGLDLGARARFLIDTYRERYEFETKVDFKVFSFQGLVNIEFVDGVPLPDDIYFEVGSTYAGIPIPPNAPVVWIIRGGGGIFGLVDTIKGRYRTLPPLALKFTGGADIAKVLRLDPLTLTASLQEISLRGDVTLNLGGMAEQAGKYTGDLGKHAKLTLITNARGLIKYVDETGSVVVEVGGSADFLGILVGDLSLGFRYDPNGNYGLFGPVWVGGRGYLKVIVPDGIPVAGGTEVVGVAVEASFHRLFGQFTVWDLPFWMQHVWGTLDMEFGAGQGPGASALAGSRAALGPWPGVYPSDDGAGTVIIGGNLRLVAMAGPEGEVLPSPAVAMAGPGVLGEVAAGDPVIASTEDFTTHTVAIQGLDNAIIALRYVGEEGEELSLERLVGPEGLTLTDPGGEPYPLWFDDPDTPGADATANARLQEFPAEETESGLVERFVYIALPEPADGEWQVTAPVPPSTVSLVEAVAAPALTGVLVSAGDSGHVYTVDWQTEHLSGGEKVALFLAEDDETSVGQLLVEDLDATAGTYQGSLPYDLPTGEYYIRAVLYKDEINFSGGYSNGFQVVDPFQPAAPAQVTAAPAGNGFLRVAWTPVAGAGGYYIQALDETGAPLPGVGAMQVGPEEAEAVIGGVYELVSQDPGTEDDDAEGTDPADVEVVGLVPGHSYQVAVTAYCDVDGAEHLSDPAVSATVALPEPQPPHLAVQVEALDGGLLPTAPGAEPGSLYLTNQSGLVLTVAPDQPLQELTVSHGLSTAFTVEDVAPGAGWTGEIALNEGHNWIHIRGVNDLGDETTAAVQVISDTTPPDLKIDPPVVAGGQVTLTGVTEPGAVVTLNNQPVTVTPDGAFTATATIGDQLQMELDLVAGDPAGNASRYTTTALNTVEPLERIELSVVGGETPIWIQPGTVARFQVHAVDAAGHRYTVDPTQVEWQLLAGTGVGHLSGEGRFTAELEGQAVVQASVPLSETYAFTDVATVTVSQDPLSDVPVPVEDQYTAYRGRTLRVSAPGVLANDVDPQRDALTAHLVSDPGHGTLTLNLDGSFTYTPDPGFTGTDPFTYRVTDGALWGGPVAVSLQVRFPSDRDEEEEPVEEPPAEEPAAEPGDDEPADQPPGEETPAPDAGADGACLPPAICVAVDPAQGGRLTSAENGLSLEIPAGALPAPPGSTVRVSAAAVPAPEMAALLAGAQVPPGFTTIGSGFSFRAQALMGQEAIDLGPFAQPVTVSISLPPAELQRIDNPEKVGLFRLNPDGSLAFVGGRVVDGRLVVQLRSFSVYVPAAAVVRFPDLAGHWAQAEVELMAARSVVRGFPDGRFQPEGPVTRAQFAAMLVRTLGLELGSDQAVPSGADDALPGSGGELPVFADVQPSDWFHDAVMTATAAGLVRGVGGQRFAPAEPVTREQIAVMLDRALHLTGGQGPPAPTAAEAEAVLASFADRSLVSDWAVRSLARLVQMGLVKGDAQGRLMPDSPATRAEAATLMARFWRLP